MNDPTRLIHAIKDFTRNKMNFLDDIQKEDFINDCLLVCLEHERDEQTFLPICYEVAKKYRNEFYDQKYKMMDHKINDEGEDLTERFYFVTPQEKEENIGPRYGEAIHNKAKKIQNASTITNYFLPNQGPLIENSNVRISCLNSSRKSFPVRTAIAIHNINSRLKSNMDAGFQGLMKSGRDHSISLREGRYLTNQIMKHYSKTFHLLGLLKQNVGTHISNQQLNIPATFSNQQLSVSKDFRQIITNKKIEHSKNKKLKKVWNLIANDTKSRDVWRMHQTLGCQIRNVSKECAGNYINGLRTNMTSLAIRPERVFRYEAPKKKLEKFLQESPEWKKLTS